MTRPMLIVADDLTGAADCGAACARLGLSVFVAMEPGTLESPEDVVALDADTRSLTSMAAAARVRQVIARCPANRLLFKKVDSTLRGHVGAELAAALDGWRDRVGRPATAIFAPAFPATGRTVIGGRPFLNGVPLEQTEIWRREGSGSPVSLSDMMSATGLATAVVELDLVRAPQLRSRMAELRRHADVLICDAESDADLAAIVHAAQTLEEETVWAGSAGLVGHVAGTVALGPSSPSGGPAAVQNGPLLFVVGSMSSVSRRQADALAAADGMVRLGIPVSCLLAKDAARPEDEWPRRLKAALTASRDVLITPVGDVAEEPGHALALRVELAALVAPFAGQIGGLFVTGGETGRAVLTALGTAGLRLHRELEPGVPLSIAAGPCRFGVVTKAGAFGTDATMLNCRQALRDLANRPPVVSFTSPTE
jgi:uncharacterized protein YgbK (DUF1537 family)